MSAESKETSSKPIWWEKTVEYEYIIKYLKPEQFAIPFDGEPEKLGDTLFMNGDTFFLIEFKKLRDSSCISAEKSKFGSKKEPREENLKNLHSALKLKSNHHFIVYGEDTKIKDEMAIKAANYFQYLATESDYTVNVKTLEKYATNRAAFEFYTIIFYWYKKCWKLVDGDSGDQGAGTDKLATKNDEGIFSSFLSSNNDFKSVFEGENSFVAVKSKKNGKISAIPIFFYMEYLIKYLKNRPELLVVYERQIDKLVNIIKGQDNSLGMEP